MGYLIHIFIIIHLEVIINQFLFIMLLLIFMLFIIMRNYHEVDKFVIILFMCCLLFIFNLGGIFMGWHLEEVFIRWELRKFIMF